MRRPTVNECLEEIHRVRLENERLARVVETRRPELKQLRTLAVAIRDLSFYLPGRLEEAREMAKAMLPPNDDDLPQLEELGGILGKGRDCVDAALEEKPNGQESISNDCRDVITTSDCHADRVAPSGGDSGLSVVTLNVEKMPEMLSAMRSELASLLREEADAESDSRLQRKLRELAARFETGA